MSGSTHLDELRVYRNRLEQSLFDVRVDQSQNHRQLTEAIGIVTHICESLENRLKAIEERIEKNDQYRQEQSER